ncbi:MAG: 4Fe-4S dicluster domain-containing protein [Candidatus Alcyoniella australis]|nr:4Fe-4S dicluster domain-containing protein [Candidatus Alcyoniella australis]
MNSSRRGFLKMLAGAGVGAAAAGKAGDALAVEDFTGWPDTYGVLVDVSKCIGCRSCEGACNDVNNLKNGVDPTDQSVFETERRSDYNVYTFVNRYMPEAGGGQPVFVKRQCMHCAEPACFAACLCKAFTKTPEGAVVYDADVCIGCRYCMQACPFYIPAYTYQSAFDPKVTKCTFCFDRISKDGGIPGCVEICPTGALTFGRREELITIARKRIFADSDYIDHIYGEREVGGTSWMYISKVPFEQLGFKTNLGSTPIPRLTYGFLWTLPILHITLPVLLAGIYSITRKREGGAHGADGGEG